MHEPFLQRQIGSWLLRQTAAAAARRVAPANAALASEVGRVRPENQDKAVIACGTDETGRDYFAAVVADGIGGMENGAHCAALATAAFIAALATPANSRSESPRDRAMRATRAANESVYQHYRGRGGTTFVALLVGENQDPIWISAGDSRIYSWAANKVTQLSVDDTIAGQLRKEGPVPAEQSKILQYIGMGSDLLPHIEKLNRHDRQMLFLTTDGTHYLAESQEWFESIIRNANDAGTAVKRLTDLANWCGGHDNATVIAFPLPVEEIRRATHNRGAIEIWDAYGDLQISIPPNENSKLTEPRHPAGQNVQKEETSNKAPGSPRSNQSRKNQNKKRDESPGKERAANDGEDASDDQSDSPQLNISFSDKPDGQTEK